MQSLLRFLKRWRRYERRGEWRVPRWTRGVYVLYQNGSADEYEVVYIGVAGVGKGGGVRRTRHDEEAKIINQ